MAVLISCIALPSFARDLPGRVFDVSGRDYIVEVDQSNAVWTGKKWMENDKLQCEYFSIRTREGFSQKHYYNASSFDNGNSPMCGKDQLYEWFEWHMGDWAWASWLGYKETADYQQYKQVAKFADEIKSSEHDMFVVKNNDGYLVAVPQNDFAHFMKLVQLGLPRDYNALIKDKQVLNPYSVNEALKIEANINTKMAKTQLMGIHAPMPWKQKE